MKIFSSLVFVFFLSLFIALPISAAPTNSAPIADANGPYKALVETVVIFDGSGSSDPEDDSLTYDWDFGDGGSGSGVSTTHTYTASGNFTVTLTVSDGEFSDSDISSVRIFLRPPAAPSSFLTPPTPADNKEASLETDLSLIFKWEEVSNAQQYRAKYWIEGDEINAVSQVIPGEERGFAIEYDTLRNGRYLWQVKSCADLDESGAIQELIDFNGDGVMESECGNYNSPRSFIYPLEETLPPPNKSQITFPNLNPGEVIIDWPDVENATSYMIVAKLDLGCSWTKKIWGLFAGGDCDPFQGLVDNMMNWIYQQFGVPARIYDPSCPWILWDETVGCNGLAVLKRAGEPELSTYQDGACTFSKGEKYKIRIASCLDDYAKKCGPLSSDLTLQVSDNLSIDPPNQIEPLYNPAEPSKIPSIGRVNNQALAWESSSCSNYIRVIVRNSSGQLVLKDDDGTAPELINHDSLTFSHENFDNIFDDPSDLGKVYSWQLQSCWRIGKNILCDEGKISPSWYFKTIGDPPQLLKPSPGEMAKIPARLSWQAIGGAGSYYYQLATDESFSSIKKEGYSTDPYVEVNYPELNASNQYWWRVKTCVDNEAKVCGNTWSKSNFLTYSINPPTNLGPIKGSLPASLKWDPDPGSNFYQYKVDYVSLDYQNKAGESLTESLDGCAEKIGTSIYSPTINSQPGATLYENCLGQYRWWARSCLDKDCSVASPPDWGSAPTQLFTAFESPAVKERGLVPCSRRSDNPNTPYNERESCQMRHIGLLIQNILDFLLWRLGLIVLGIFSIMTGAISYFSLGGPGTLDRIKSIWKSAGIGYGIMLISWILVNLILSLAGFQVQFFGRWFQLPF